MKKILYISLHNLKENKDGVSKKINSQIKALEKNNLIVDYIYRNESGIYLNSVDNIIDNKSIKGRKAINSIYKNANKLSYDYIYIRYEGTTFLKLKALKKWKKNGGKIIIEIPTYPYKGEKRGKKQQVIYFYKEFYNLFLKQSVDYIVTFSDDSKIFGIPCINISNGVDFENTIMITKTNHQTLTFTSVSSCANWHGIDRFLNSLEYYFKYNRNTKKITFNIVGEGSETNELKDIVNKSEYLNDTVVFHGFKSGDELDRIYNKTDICVGCLGNHRKGIYTLQALKNKEYAAKGLPMIFSEDDPGLRHKEYVYRATNDENLIDISDVIRWYGELKTTPKEIRDSINDFSWETQMKKIISKIEEE